MISNIILSDSLQRKIFYSSKNVIMSITSRIINFSFNVNSPVGGGEGGGWQVRAGTGKWPLSAVERGISLLSQNWYIIWNTFVYLKDLVTTVNQIQFDLWNMEVWNIFLSQNLVKQHHVVDVEIKEYYFRFFSLEIHFIPTI